MSRSKYLLLQPWENGQSGPATPHARMDIATDTVNVSTTTTNYTPTVEELLLKSLVSSDVFSIQLLLLCIWVDQVAPSQCNEHLFS